MKSSEISKLDKHRGRNFCIGLISALSFVLACFNYTTYADLDYDYDAPPVFEEEEVIVFRTPKNPKTKVVPRAVEITEKIEELEEKEFIEEQEPEPIQDLVDEKIVEKEVVEYVAPAKPKPQPKPTPPVIEPEEPKEDFTEYLVVEHMPRFPGCEDKGLKKEERKVCSQKAMLEFIYKNIKYPIIAVENGIKGTVVVSFLVDKDGNTSDFKIVRDIGGGCGQEAIRVVKNMPQWIPGIQQGRKVNVRYNMPVKYKLH